MGEPVRLEAADGHKLNAYLARPSGSTLAGLVVAQEIFGVNAHIRAVVDGFAEHGYLAIAPALFDRKERGVELAYEGEDLAKGRALRGAIPWDAVMQDMAAAIDAVDEAGKVGTVGYCWGGSVAWLAACRLPVAAAVGYYGGQIYEHRHDTPNCPTLLHFGERDAMIPMDQVNEIRRLRPEIQVRTYPADHGFNCDHRGSYHEASAAIALERSLDFLAAYLT